MLVHQKNREIKRSQAFVRKGYLCLKADCLDFRTDSLMLFPQKKAFLIKKSALLNTTCCENIQISPHMIKKEFAG
jgi:hypothetical protein